jgi:hypothetical protein
MSKRNPELKFLAAADLDRLAALVFELSAQLHIERHKRMALEQALLAKGVLATRRHRRARRRQDVPRCGARRGRSEPAQAHAHSERGRRQAGAAAQGGAVAPPLTPAGTPGDHSCESGQTPLIREGDA